MGISTVPSQTDLLLQTYGSFTKQISDYYHSGAATAYSIVLRDATSPWTVVKYRTTWAVSEITWYVSDFVAGSRAYYELDGSITRVYLFTDPSPKTIPSTMVPILRRMDTILPQPYFVGWGGRLANSSIDQFDVLSKLAGQWCVSSINTSVNPSQTMVSDIALCRTISFIRNGFSVDVHVLNTGSTEYLAKFVVVPSLAQPPNVNTLVLYQQNTGEVSILTVLWAIDGTSRIDAISFDSKQPEIRPRSNQSTWPTPTGLSNFTSARKSTFQKVYDAVNIDCVDDSNCVTTSTLKHCIAGKCSLSCTATTIRTCASPSQCSTTTGSCVTNPASTSGGTGTTTGTGTGTGTSTMIVGSVCSNTSQCVSMGGYCVDGKCAMDCTTDTQCLAESGQRCFNGKCQLPITSQCSLTDSTRKCNDPALPYCRSDGVCVADCTTSEQCASADSTKPYCLAPVTSYAGDGTVITTKRQCAAKCQSNQDCPQTAPNCRATLDGTCSAACSTSLECSGSTPYCVNSQCSAKCTSNSQCPTNYPFCVSSGSCQAACSSATQCLPGQVCKDGACQSCSSTSDCNTGFICLPQGSCVSETNQGIPQPNNTSNPNIPPTTPPPTDAPPTTPPATSPPSTTTTSTSTTTTTTTSSNAISIQGWYAGLTDTNKAMLWVGIGLAVLVILILIIASVSMGGDDSTTDSSD